MKVHHIGYCVRNINKSKYELEKMGFIPYEQTYKDGNRKIYIQFMKNGETIIELVSPTGEGKSPVDGILGKIGDTVYHICYETNNIYAEIDRLKAEKYIVVAMPEQAVAIANNKVVFLFKKNVGLIELVEIK